MILLGSNAPKILLRWGFVGAYTRARNPKSQPDLDTREGPPNILLYARMQRLICSSFSGCYVLLVGDDNVRADDDLHRV